MHALVAAGADVIELGIPFSDPMADGPVIQKASERALARGVGLAQVLAMVREFRAARPGDAGRPHGLREPDRALRRARASSPMPREAGVDGVLVVDYPPEECAEFAQQLRRRRHRPDLPRRADLDRRAHRRGRQGGAADTFTMSR